MRGLQYLAFYALLGAAKAQFSISGIPSDCIINYHTTTVIKYVYASAAASDSNSSPSSGLTASTKKSDDDFSTSTSAPDTKTLTGTTSQTTSTSSTSEAALTNDNVADLTTTSAKDEDTTTSSTSATTSSTTSTTTTSSDTEATSTGFDFESVYLAKHNYYRNLHQDTPSLTWSDGVAAVAQSYADQYSCDGQLVHSGNSYNGNSLGENLAYGYDFESAAAVDAWYNEIKDYNFDDPSYSESTGHFTQLVWKSSTTVGCGYKNCGNGYGYYVVCNYQPAGNVIWAGSDKYQLFAENVMPLKD